MAAFQEDRAHEIKICLIGDTDVGKTTLSKRYVDGNSPDNTTPTIGASFLQKRLTVDGIELSLQIWDTAGQERFRSMATMYYRNAKAAICVFDVSNEESFNRVASWLSDLRQNADPEVVVTIVGNKCDKKPSFDLATCARFAEEPNVKFFKASALTGENVDEVFNELASRVSEVYVPQLERQEAHQKETLRLKSQKRSNKKGCC